MATYVVVDKDVASLGPNEVRAGNDILVENGDVFIISDSVSDNIKFVSATGEPTNFDIRIETSNSNNFDIEVKENLDVGIVISNDVQIPDVDINANKALAVVMTAGDNVSLGHFKGSENGTDVLTIGDGFSTDHDIDLNGGDNFLSIGDNAIIQGINTEDGTDSITIGDGLIANDIKLGDGANSVTIGNNATLGNIETGDGNDVLTFGDGLVADDIKTGDGNNALTVGNNATLDDIETGNGDNVLTFGDGLVADDFKTGDGANAITIGNDALVDDIQTGDGNDTVSVGDGFTADQFDTGNGNDLVISGVGGFINDLDGGNGNDTLSSDTAYPNASSFETICFAKGTRIETDRGLIEIEDLRVGDRVRTMDNGFQPIRWINSTAVAGRGIHAPVRIAAGALGNARPLWVSQQHRMFLNSAEAELYFAEPEVLVAAKNLLGFAGIDKVEVHTIHYFHMLFDQHEIVYAEGIPSESFFPGAVGLDTLSAEACIEIYSLFPELEGNSGSFGKPARSVLKPHEARILAA